MNDRLARRYGFHVCSALLLLCAAADAPAQPAASVPLDTTERREVVERIARLLEENYVFADVGTRSGAHLRERLAAGAFDGMDDALTYAEALTRELQGANHDKHMRVTVRQPSAATGPLHDLSVTTRQLREMRSRNFGFERVEHLEGNVGYLDLRYFAPPELAREIAVASMQLLSNSDAIIVDLRNNDGGSPELVQLLCSYFFEPRVHLNSLYWRRGDRTQEFWTLEDLPGRRLPRVPLFVLTSAGTFSGAEEFTYNMQTRNRATIIGGTTGGGANPGGTMRVNDRFVIFVPTGRAINPVTGTNWEGVGVKPDLRVDASLALDSALARARVAARGYAEAEVALETARQDALMRRLDEASRLIEREEIAAAERSVGEALSRAIADRFLDERAINGMGYHYLQAGRRAMAIAVFKANVAAFPQSANTYDSLGEAFMENGDRDRAIHYYRESLARDANNTNARAMLERLASTGEPQAGDRP